MLRFYSKNCYLKVHQLTICFRLNHLPKIIAQPVDLPEEAPTGGDIEVGVEGTEDLAKGSALLGPDQSGKFDELLNLFDIRILLDVTEPKHSSEGEFPLGIEV